MSTTSSNAYIDPVLMKGLKVSQPRKKRKLTSAHKADAMRLILASDNEKEMECAAQEHIPNFPNMQFHKITDETFDGLLNLLDKMEDEEEKESIHRSKRTEDDEKDDVNQKNLVKVKPSTMEATPYEDIEELDVEDDDDQKDAPLQPLEKVHTVTVIAERKTKMKKVPEKKVKPLTVPKESFKNVAKAMKDLSPAQIELDNIKLEFREELDGEKEDIGIKKSDHKLQTEIDSFFADNLIMPLTNSQIAAERENYKCSLDKEIEFDDYQESIVDIICGEFEAIFNQPPSMGDIVSIMVEAAELIKSAQQCSRQDGVFDAEFRLWLNIRENVWRHKGK